jgi:hypothetical protein
MDDQPSKETGSMKGLGSLGDFIKAREQANDNDTPGQESMDPGSRVIPVQQIVDTFEKQNKRIVRAIRDVSKRMVETHDLTRNVDKKVDELLVLQKRIELTLNQVASRSTQTSNSNSPSVNPQSAPTGNARKGVVSSIWNNIGPGGVIAGAAAGGVAARLLGQAGRLVWRALPLIGRMGLYGLGASALIYGGYKGYQWLYGDKKKEGDTQEGKKENVEVRAGNEIEFKALHGITFNTDKEIRFKAQRIIFDGDVVGFDEEGVRSNGNPNRRSQEIRQRRDEAPGAPSTPGFGGPGGFPGAEGGGQGINIPPNSQYPSPTAPGKSAPGSLTPQSAPTGELPEIPKQFDTTKQSHDMTIDQAVGAQSDNSTGPIDRSKYVKELQENPETRKLFQDMMEAEVGGSQYTDRSKRAFAETVFNRAHEQGKSVAEILGNKSYYQPYKDGGLRKAQERLTPEKRAQLDSHIDHVGRGSNITNGATHNGSGSVAASVYRGGYDADTNTAQTIDGETYYRKLYEKNMPPLRETRPKATAKDDVIAPESRVIEDQGRVANTRKRALDPTLKDQLEYAAEKAGLEYRVTSGGQPSAQEGGPRVGTERHDHGRAADGELYKKMPDGSRRKLNFTKEEDLALYEQMVEASAAAGMTGMGAGVEYMGNDRIHLGGGKEATWGSAFNKGSRLRNAYERGRANPIDLNAWKQERAAKALPRMLQKIMPTQAELSSKASENVKDHFGEAAKYWPGEEPKPVPLKDRAFTSYAGMPLPVQPPVQLPPLQPIIPREPNITEVQQNDQPSRRTGDHQAGTSEPPPKATMPVTPDPMYNEPEVAPPIVPKDNKRVGGMDSDRHPSGAH